jgi:amino acid transporter
MSSERAEDASQQPLLFEHRQADHDASASRGTFTRTLGAVEAFGIVVSIVIGSGVFTSPGSIDTNVPSPGLALVIWLIGGVLAWTGATTFAELGTAIPGEGKFSSCCLREDCLTGTGGVQPYLQHIYGDIWGFLAAWTWIVTVMPATLAILSIVFVESAYSAAGVINEDHRISHKLLSILVLIVMSIANSISTKASTRLNGFFVVLKFVSILVVVMAALAVVGVHATHPDKEAGGGDWFKKNWFEYRDTYNPNGPDTDWSKLSQWEIFGHYSAALYAALWAYSGWDKVSSRAFATRSCTDVTRPSMFLLNFHNLLSNSLLLSTPQSQQRLSVSSPPTLDTTFCFPGMSSAQRIAWPSLPSRVFWAEASVSSRLFSSV